MAKRIKKPPVTLERRQDWLRRYEEGESPPKIAARDNFDIRTVRKHIEVAKQEKEAKEARSMVLRNAMERHYADLCAYAESLSGLTSMEAGAGILKYEYLATALRQHLPRSPIWGYLKQKNSLEQRIEQLIKEAGTKIEESVKADSGLRSALADTEAVAITGAVTALQFQLEQWARGHTGLNVKDSLIATPAEEGHVNLRYGAFGMGRVKTEHIAVIREALPDWESHIRQWDEYKVLEKAFLDLRRTEKNLRDELAVITLRRIVPGRCRYCPL